MSSSPLPLILASSSPQRRELLTEAGYEYKIVPPHPSAECGVCSRETASALVTRLAYQKAQDVAQRTDRGIVVGCDTVAECRGQILGKPRSRDHAREILCSLRGRDHYVYSGLCVWKRPHNERLVRVEKSRLRMESISDSDMEDYLDSEAWQGKAGAFGLQDRTGWLHILEGSESNVIGLPLTLLEDMLAEIQAV